MISDEEINKLARLARLELTPEEAARFARDIGPVLGYVEKLKSVDVGGTEAMSHVHGVTNVFRQDTAAASMSGEEALENAPDSSGSFIRVPLIIE